MSETAKKNPFSSRIFKTIIMLGLMFGIGFIPAPAPLTTFGMKLLGVFIGVLFGWIFIEIGSTSIIALIALAVTGVSDFTTIIAGTFGTQNTLMLIGILFLSVYIEKTELGQVIINWLLRRKIVVGRPYVFFFFCMLGSYLIALASSSFVALFIMLTLFAEINSVAKFKLNSKENCMFLVSFVISSMLAEHSLPIKTMIVVYFGIFTSYTGIVIDSTRFLLAMIPAAIVILLLLTLFCKFIIRTDFSGLVEGSKILAAKPAITMTKKQKVGFAVLIIYIFAMLIPALPFNSAFWVMLKGFGLGGLSLLVIGIFSFLHIDGEPVFDFKEITKGFSWDLLFMVPTIIFLAGQLTKDEAGIKMFLTEVLYPVLSNLNPSVLVFVLIALTVLLTNFANNIIVGSVMITFLSLIAVNIMNLNVIAAVIVVSVSSMVCVATPAGSPNTAIAFSQKDYVDYKHMFIYGIATVVFLCLCLCFIIWPYINFVM